jgi:hypothetical protein
MFNFDQLAIFCLIFFTHKKNLQTPKRFCSSQPLRDNLGSGEISFFSFKSIIFSRMFFWLNFCAITQGFGYMKRILDNLRLNFYNFLNNFMASPANT